MPNERAGDGVQLVPCELGKHNGDLVGREDLNLYSFDPRQHRACH